MRFEARRVIAAVQGEGSSSAARVLSPPEIVARATGTCVVPAAKQRSQTKA